MPGPTDRSPAAVVRDFFDGPEYEPLTAREIAAETEYSAAAVRDELDVLVDRDLLRTKELTGGRRVWWPAIDQRTERAELVDAMADASEDPDAQITRQQLIERHRHLAQFVTEINITADLDEILRQITEVARELVGAHQSVTSRTLNQNWEQAINAVSLSEKYAEYSDYDTEPDGSGIYSVVCERNEPMRVTQDELESHPAWQAFGDEADEHPPMDGWLAVPIVGPEGENTGLIQLSDRYDGEFTEADEAILVQLANVASAAIENARLYDELRESEERYRTLFDSMTEGYCVVEPAEPDDADRTDYRFLEANPAFEAHTGLRDVAGCTVREADVADPGAWFDVLDSVADSTDGGPFQRELEMRGRVLQCQAFPIGGASGGQVGMTARDVTERVERERRLEESNERLEQFAYAASHDLQEPLRMVSSYLQLLENRYADDLDDEAREFLAFAVDGADRMREMIDGLLEYSRVETEGDPLEPVDLNAVFSDVRDDLQVAIEESGADVAAEDLPRVRGDGDQLRQVFQNLVDNAIEYSGDEPPTVRVGAERAGDRWVVSVRDEGIGIDPEYADAIFQVFERLHTSDEYSGTGIGLALCERIVERHGGELWVDAEPGEGSTFSFTLPTVDSGE
ncbi:ATP-binding protein [Halosimplex aquaticum]|uniref:histidine kinase n=1 Tax=Halosimplex aquaticum TaxID=3026162 RepID=A0ABD5Y4D3_9EURY|nr:ATP-binding protein [Halosimplex aquaticum]